MSATVFINFHLICINYLLLQQAIPALSGLKHHLIYLFIFLKVNSQGGTQLVSAGLFWDLFRLGHSCGYNHLTTQVGSDSLRQPHSHVWGFGAGHWLSRCLQQALLVFIRYWKSSQQQERFQPNVHANFSHLLVSILLMFHWPKQRM